MQLNDFLTNFRKILKDILPNGRSKRKSPPIERVYYVVVVHGIGEQKLNSTLTPVINRFAEVRQKQYLGIPSKKKYPLNMVTLGMVTAQTGIPYQKDREISFDDTQPWAEFDNIKTDKETNEMFEAKSAIDGENIRFVELHWADILNEHFIHSGESLKVWSQALLDRVSHQDLKQESWIPKILAQLRTTLLFLYRLFAFFKPSVKRLVFDKFLGDVQIYGENPRVRAKAVARFHNLMEKLELKHYEREAQIGKNRPPRFIIIAHSLGTVLTLDALVYGHLRDGLRRSFLNQHYLSLPFPSYEESFQSNRWDHENEIKKYIGDHWIDHVHAFVTLGSPIDKYLTLWPHNYDFLGEEGASKSPIEKLFKNRQLNKIKHYNYCDEQDPVGDKLEKLRDRPVYQRLFDPVEEDFFNRYVLPGYAHNKYWTDAGLFEKILVHTVDEPVEDDKQPDQRRPQSKPEPFPRTSGKYWKLIFNSYLLIPIITLLITAPLLLWGWYAAKANNWIQVALSILLNMQLTFILRHFTGLSIWWRQMLRLRGMEGLAHETYVQHKDARLFKYWMWTLLWVLVIMCLCYVPGSINKITSSAENCKEYQSQSIYISVLVILKALRLSIQIWWNIRNNGSAFIDNLWQLAEFKNTVWFTVLLGLCIALSNFDFYIDYIYILKADFLYREVISWVLLDATLIWLFVMVYFYDVRRKIDLMNQENTRKS